MIWLEIHVSILLKEEDIVAYTFGFDFGLGPKLLVDAAGSLQHVIKNTPHRDDQVAAQTLSRLVFRYSFLQVSSQSNSSAPAGIAHTKITTPSLDALAACQGVMF